MTSETVRCSPAPLDSYTLSSLPYQTNLHLRTSYFINPNISVPFCTSSATTRSTLALAFLPPKSSISLAGKEPTIAISFRTSSNDWTSFPTFRLSKSAYYGKRSYTFTTPTSLRSVHIIFRRDLTKTHRKIISSRYIRSALGALECWCCIRTIDRSLTQVYTFFERYREVLSYINPYPAITLFRMSSSFMALPRLLRTNTHFP